MNSLKYKQNIKKSFAGKLILSSIVFLIIILFCSLFYDVAGTTDIVLLIGIILSLVVAYQINMLVLFTDKEIKIKIGPLNIKTISMYDIENISTAKINPILDTGGWGIRLSKNFTAFIFEGASIIKIKSKNNTETIITYPENINEEINLFSKQFL